MSKRVKFFISHLLLSLCVMGVILTFVLMVWYPTPLARAVGVTQIMLILASIDVVVGPVLGFLVYKEHKKSLKFDLAIVILLQCSALIYGIYSVAQGRPVWIVYNVDRFELIKNNELIVDNIKQAKEQFRNVSWLNPQWAATQFAKNSKERQDDMFNEIVSGMTIAQRPERYVDLTEVNSQIKSRALELSNLFNYNTQEEVQRLLEKYPEANYYLPMKANKVDMSVLIDKEGNVIKIVDLRPWNTQ